MLLSTNKQFHEIALHLYMLEMILQHWKKSSSFITTWSSCLHRSDRTATHVEWCAMKWKSSCHLWRPWSLETDPPSPHQSANFDPSFGSWGSTPTCCLWFWRSWCPQHQQHSISVPGWSNGGRWWWTLYLLPSYKGPCNTTPTSAVQCTDIISLWEDCPSNKNCHDNFKFRS